MGVAEASPRSGRSVGRITDFEQLDALHALGLGERCWVRANAVCLLQVLHNLLGNAAKFTSRGLVQFTVHPAGGLIVFEVIDTGPAGSANDQSSPVDQ